MLDQVPPLLAKQPGPLVQVAGLLSTSVRSVIDQIEPYTQWWDRQNQEALTEPGPLLVVVGDSSAIGIGASHPANGYVGRLLGALFANRSPESDDGSPRLGDGLLPNHVLGQQWRVINLGQSGAKFDDGLQRQIPIVAQIEKADLVVCCLGTNDLVWGLNTTSLRDKATTMVRALTANRSPDDYQAMIVCSVAGKSPRARMVNRAIKGAADNHPVSIVNPWTEPGPDISNRLAADRFHLNDLGYSLMAKAVGRELGVDAGEDQWHKVSDEWT